MWFWVQFVIMIILLSPIIIVIIIIIIIITITIICTASSSSDDSAVSNMEKLVKTLRQFTVAVMAELDKRKPSRTPSELICLLFYYR